MHASDHGGYFQELGRTLEAAWSRCDRDEERFPDLAAEALAARPPRDHVDLEALIDRILDPAAPAARQLAPLGAFGQPGVTVHYGQGFVVDVYFWTRSLSAIHDHPFCGVFTLLQGFSVHARYDFEEREALSVRARLGQLSLRSLERVEPGHVERFSHRRYPLIHALLHVPVPSVSMVVRTIRTLGYLRYFPPTVALAMDAPDDTTGRALALLDALRESGHPRYGERLLDYLTGADFETTFRCLSGLWPSSEDGERARVLEVVRRRHGARTDAIPPALERALTTHEGDEMRTSIRDPDDRFVATGLMVAERREPLLALLASVHDDPVARLHRFIDEAGLFAPDEAASALIAHALADGEDVGGATSRLVDHYGEAAVEEQRDAIRRYCTRSPFACLAGAAARDAGAACDTSGTQTHS